MFSGLRTFKIYMIQKHVQEGDIGIFKTHRL